jgi:hypothetical protein
LCYAYLLQVTERRERLTEPTFRQSVTLLLFGLKGFVPELVTAYALFDKMNAMFDESPIVKQLLHYGSRTVQTTVE